MCHFTFVGTQHEVPQTLASTVDDNTVSCESPSLSTFPLRIDSSEIMRAWIKNVFGNMTEFAVAGDNTDFIFYSL